jgi:predicted permease
MHIVFPKPAMTALGMLGASASPAVLVSLGIFMGQGFILNKTLFYSAGLTLAKLVLLPLLFILVLKATGLYGSDAARVSVLEAGMPCGLTAFALSQSYPMDRDCIAQAVIISTFLSMITLPLLAAMM